MKSGNFCPVCGKQKARFIKGFCEQCFLKKHSVAEIPEKVSFQLCRTCGKIFFQGKMQPFDKELLSELVEGKVKVHDLENSTVVVSIEENSQKKLFAKVFVKGIIDAVPISIEKNVELQPAKAQCDACMRLSSQYHEAIIQLRGKSLEKALSEVAEAIESQRQKDSLAAVTEVSKKKGGFDLKVGSKRAAFNAAKHMKQEFNAEIKTSSKLLGVDKKGREKHRFTFLIRV